MVVSSSPAVALRVWLVGVLCALSGNTQAQHLPLPDVAGSARGAATLPFRASDVLPLLDESPRDRAPLLGVGLAPLALSSLPSPPLDAAASESPSPPDWLEGIAFPDLPIRWDDRVTDMLRYFRDDTRGRALIRGWLQRSGRYGHIIREVMRRHDLPEDLMYVAMVESGFDPTARSGVGAVGLWQFMSVAADEYGLQRSKWLDERIHPERATEAAARFLRDMYARFGSWELALAAYNMGHGGLVRTIRKYNTNDYWTLSKLEAGLPYETMVYVAKIMACAVVGRNPERFDLQDVPIEAPLDFRYVDVPAGVTLQRVARAASVEVDALAALNPELLKQRVPPETTVYAVRIPTAHVAKFQHVWSRQHPTPPSHRTYVVRFGEELADIAYTFRTTTTMLKRLNEIESDSEVVPGYRLLVPAVEPRPRDPSSPAVVSVPQAALEVPGKKRVFYTCTGRETAAGIARYFRVDLDDLRRWNALATTATIQRGMVMQVFVDKDRSVDNARILGDDDVVLLEVGSDAFFDHHETQRGRVRVHYRVQPNDSLHSLASRFDLSVGSIARINGFSRDTLLKSDQEIVLYVPEASMKSLPPEHLAVAPTTATAQEDSNP